MTVSVRKPERPRLWIVAGPNGSGKSTAYDRSDIDEFGGSVWIINPDLLTRRIVEQEHLALDDANREAVERIERWLEASIAVHQTIGVETVLSTPKYRPLVARAKTAGFEVRLIYVLLESADMQFERIKLRVEKGGHDVPVEKVISRRLRSFQQLPWFLKAADRAWILDNSGAEARHVGFKRDGTIVIDPSAPKDLIAALQAAAD